VKVGAKLMAVVLILFLVVDILLSLIAGRGFRREVERARKSGVPTTYQELAKGTPKQDNEPARLIRQASKYIQTSDREMAIRDFLLFRGSNSKEWLKRCRDGKTPEQVEQDCRKAVAECEPAVRILRQAGDYPECKFAVKWSDPLDTNWSHHGAIRRCVELLAARAVLQARDGNMDAAADDTVLLLKLLRIIEAEPDAGSFLSNVSRVRLATDSLQEAIRTRTVTEAQTSRLQRELGKIELDRGLRLALKEELVRSLYLFDKALKDPYWPRSQICCLTTGDYEGPGWVELTLFATAELACRPVAYRNGRAFVSHHLTLTGVIDKPYRMIPPRDFEFAGVRSEIPISNIIWFSPMPSGLWASRDVALAQVGLARTALALKSIKNSTGAYPASLKGMQHSSDPFSGKPFVYKRSDNGFILYSLGQNLKDDGGKTKSASSNPNAYDIVWRCDR
jgi:hypothetical protein